MTSAPPAVEAARRPTGASAGGLPAATLAVFTASVFTSAFLLFLVQPLFGRMALPRLGGSPAVWNTCMLFFQAALLAGYLYAHLSSRALGVRAQAVVHLGLMAAAALALPIALGERIPRPDSQPVLWLLGVMAVTVGPPFAVLAGTGPLLQRWFAHTGHRSASDPYSLYAASNLGSTLALFAYPALVEPAFRLAEQSRGWALGYGLLALLVLGSALFLRRGAAPPAPHEGPLADAPLRSADRLLWVALAFVPSSTLLGVTTHLTTDLAPVPLLWVLPLGIYLLTFTLAFARRPLVSGSLMLQIQPALLVAVGILMLQSGGGLLRRPALGVSLHLVALFVTGMVCHGELVRRRPHVRHLTEFYLWISVGGVAGGIFNVIVAPLAFPALWEYPLLLALAALARPWRRTPHLLPALAAAASAAALVWATGRPSGLTTPAGLAAAGVGVALATLVLSRTPLWLGAALAVFLGVRSYQDVHREGTLLASRSFFGTYRVARVQDPSGVYHTLTHGTTLHGAQNREPDRRGEPQTYYLAGGPLDEALQAARAPAGSRRVAFVGLGTGTGVVYAHPGEAWTFFEIDPGIERIARDTALFSYLADAPVEAGVLIGDARLRLAEASPGAFDVIALDAFTSDAVPIHLLTREAMDLYLEKLAPGGLIVYHVSNRYLDVRSVVATLARDRGLAGRVSEGPDRHAAPFDQYATWVAMARSVEDLGALAEHPRWRPLQPTRPLRPWTDDYSSVLSVMEW